MLLAMRRSWGSRGFGPNMCQRTCWTSSAAAIPCAVHQRTCVDGPAFLQGIKKVGVQHSAAVRFGGCRWICGSERRAPRPRPRRPYSPQRAFSSCARRRPCR